MSAGLPAALLLAACGNLHFPMDASGPRPGSHEREVADLPTMGELADWSTHWRDDDRLLIRMSADTGAYLAVVDRDGTVTNYCNSVSGGYDGPLRVGWTNDVGMWDVVDGELALRTTDDAMVRCATNGAVTRFETAHESWPTTSVLVEGGYVDWPTGAAQPARWSWADGTSAPLPYEGPPPTYVTKTRDARGLWFVTAEGGALTLWQYDGDAGTFAQLYTADLGGATVTTYVNAQPDAFVVDTDRGLLAASGTLGDGFHAFPELTGQLTASDAVFAWPDGRGFSVWGRDLSVNLADERVVTEGYVTPQGLHFTLSGDPASTTVSVVDNAVDGGVVDTWTADLSTSFDWLDGVVGDATFEAFGFENGVCGLARWGMSWGMDGRPIPYDPGDEGWEAADSVVYLGRCGQPLTEVSRGLWSDLARFSYGGTVVVKTDVPVFGLVHGEREEEGFSDIMYTYEGWHVDHPGWAVDAHGDLVPMFDEADGYLVRRRGGVAWTLHDRTLYRVDVTRDVQ